MLKQNKLIKVSNPTHVDFMPGPAAETGTPHTQLIMGEMKARPRKPTTTIGQWVNERSGSMREVRRDHYPQCMKGHLLSSTSGRKDQRSHKEARFGLHQKGPQKEFLLLQRQHQGSEACRGSSASSYPCSKLLLLKREGPSEIESSLWFGFLPQQGEIL